ncbi:MAG: hypothetical protein ACRD4E_10160, partial [Bryobacteraceae bacterium]
IVLRGNAKRFRANGLVKAARCIPGSALLVDVYHEVRLIRMRKNVVASRLGFSLLALCTLAHAFQQHVTPPDSDREKDVYAIYSLMLTNPQTSHGPDRNERFLIAVTTAPPHAQEPCVRPPTERQADFQEMRTDYERRRAMPRELKAVFSISKPYVLLNADEAQNFIESRWPKPGHGSPPVQFKGVTDLFTLSDVYFNQQGNLALTGISNFCGNLCALYQWKVFEKSDTGKWEDTGWPACRTIA